MTQKRFASEPLTDQHPILEHSSNIDIGVHYAMRTGLAEWREGLCASYGMIEQATGVLAGYYSLRPIVVALDLPPSAGNGRRPPPLIAAEVKHIAAHDIFKLKDMAPLLLSDAIMRAQEWKLGAIALAYFPSPEDKLALVYETLGFHNWDYQGFWYFFSSVAKNADPGV